MLDDRDDIHARVLADLGGQHHDEPPLPEPPDEDPDRFSDGTPLPPDPAGEPAAGPGKGRARRKPSARDILVGIAEQRFTLGLTEDDRVYAVDKEGPNVALSGGQAKRVLAAAAWQATGTAPGRSPLDEAWTVLEAVAHNGPKAAIPLRVADHGPGTVIDLGDQSGACIVVSPEGWKVQPRSPVTFRRSRATMPLPRPAPEGDWEPLWDVVNVRPEDRGILRGWAVAALIRDVSHPILQIRGEQGSAKTSGTGMLARLVDPSAADTLKPPKDSDAWASSVSARWVVPVDNVSRIEPWWSDDLCRTVTGTGVVKRALYTDDEHVVQVLRGAIILNGIGLSTALRGDLAERLLPVELRRPAAYRTERSVADTFTRGHPAVLTALLDDLAAAQSRLHTVPAPADLRMADFAHILAAHDKAAGTRTLAHYRKMHEDAAEEALEDDPIAQAVLEFMHNRTAWDGRPGELLDQLDRIREASPRRGDFWPNSASVMGSALTRSAPVLRLRGIAVERPPRSGKGGRRVRLVRTEGQP